MLILEARFRSTRGETSPVVVVGRVVWSDPDDVHPIVQPAPDLPWATTLLVKLRYLIGVMSPDSFERLKGLHSQFWSFVEVSPSPSTKTATPRPGS